ncbi:hypothetical protein ACFSWD_06520 [Paenibacillus xanthanilyticus]
MTKTDKTRVHVHQIVKGTYSVFTDECGKKYFQIDTYGTESREILGKISQSIQFDEESALYLIQLIKKEMGQA